MTIGEKIKYFRTRIGITQAKLAELSGIHPVSIRKYETNKMVPQSPQIDRIAEALGISSFAIAGFENNIRLETIGDFMGLLIMLIKTKIVVVNGERGADDIYKPETVSFEVNPLISQFFNANISEKEFNAKDIMYHLKRKNLLQDLLSWEKINYGYEKCAAKYSDTPDKNTQAALEQLKNDKEAIEMELQRSGILLDTKDGISVKIPPDIFN
ncbi:helix-turn-helix domain-containing protein [Qingrenia yutianensis]|uniref:Helix-turn-helix transcriptional regulator n=1 Tax=Qingrenia yutianensis TaxID=2763676 RepID=A0A926FDY0_9FIRM|nr:helix-turn-helix transcriptional regulator [Qingrenia yutianensis]MBC8597437.1 helix-turn-helix transcriptional regulator [Qingrenia yutianensis]